MADIGDLLPGQKAMGKLELPKHLLGKIGKFVLRYSCAGCEHDHEQEVVVRIAEKMQVGFACPCCTPRWLKIRNFIRRVIFF